MKVVIIDYKKTIFVETEMGIISKFKFEMNEGTHVLSDNNGNSLEVSIDSSRAYKLRLNKFNDVVIKESTLIEQTEGDFLFNGKRIIESNGVYKLYTTDEVVSGLTVFNSYLYTTCGEYNTTESDFNESDFKQESTFEELIKPFKDFFNDESLKGISEDVKKSIVDFIKNNQNVNNLKLKLILKFGSLLVDKSNFGDIFKKK